MLAALQKEVDTNAGHARKAAVSGKQQQARRRALWPVPAALQSQAKLVGFFLWPVYSSKPLLLPCAQAACRCACSSVL